MNAIGSTKPGRFKCGIVSIDQRHEIPFDSVLTQHAGISYLHARSRESHSNDIEGQDYLVFSYDERMISFVVCDGVSQSFCGHLAAVLLGDALVKWLGGLGAVASEGDLSLIVTSFLNELTNIGQQRVLEYVLPEDLAPLTRTALEEQRSYGSETMFVGGRLQFPQDPTDPSADGRLLLCWLGDTEVQVLDLESRPVDIGAEWATRQRWSTAKGVRGIEQVPVWISGLSKVSRIIAYSDGLSSLADRLYELVRMPERLQQETERIYDSPESDDISLIDIRLTASSPSC